MCSERTRSSKKCVSYLHCVQRAPPPPGLRPAALSSAPVEYHNETKLPEWEGNLKLRRDPHLQENPAELLNHRRLKGRLLVRLRGLARKPTAMGFGNTTAMTKCWQTLETIACHMKCVLFSIVAYHPNDCCEICLVHGVDEESDVRGRMPLDCSQSIRKRTIMTSANEQNGETTTMRNPMHGTSNGI